MGRKESAEGTISVRHVAEHAGVSVGTVSNVLNHPEKVSGPMVERVHRAILDLGFVRNDTARQLRAGRSPFLGLVVLDVRNPFFTDLARGAEDAAASSGLSVILGNSDEDSVREAAYLDIFERQRVHGLLISPYGDIGDRLERMRSRGIPTVLVDRWGGKRPISSVSVDDVGGGRLAVEHLLSVGRRHIAYVGGPLEIRQVADRLEGAREAVEKQADAVLDVLSTDALDVRGGRTVGAAIAAQRSTERPDAVFAANDLIALGVMQGLRGAGAGALVPADMAIVGYDDIDFAGAAAVALTSVRQPSGLIGQKAVEILLEEAADPHLAPRQIVFQPELVVRESTVPVGRP